MHINDALSRFRNTHRAGRHPRFFMYARLMADAAKDGRLPLAHEILVAAYFAWDAVVARAQRRGKRWAHGPDGIRLPLACAGGPLVVAACFWLGRTARSDVPWAVPVLAMVPFGICFLLLFMDLLNYLVDVCKTFAASAIAAAGTTRSVCGAALPER